MNCPTTEQLESAVLSGSPGTMGPELRAHVEACKDCAQRVNEVKENLRLAERLQAPGAPVDGTVTTGVPVLDNDGPGELLQLPGYKILKEISRGGQGVVYQAVQTSTRRKVAIKVLRAGHFADECEGARFEREIQILGQLKHPNIVTIYDSGAVDGHPYYVMDYIAGAPLHEYVAERRLAVKELLRLFATICDAVHAAHLRGIIHRDLKPTNIRVDEGGHPHVLDFGLAKTAGESDAAAMTMTGQFLGSLPWSSPEQAEGQPARIDIRSDVYSLGVVLYHLLTGGFPYDVRGSVREVLDRVVHAEPLRPSRTGSTTGPARERVDDEVETIVLKCLAKERERRYQSAGEMARDVRNYLSGAPLEAKRDSGLYLLRKTLRRYRRTAVVAACFVVMLVAGSVNMFVLWQNSEAHRVRAERRASEAQQAADGLNVLLRTRGDLDAGEAHFRDVLRRNRSQFGEEHPHVATARFNLGALLAAQGKYEEAEQMLREVRRVRVLLFGEQHPQVAQANSTLAAALFDQGRYEAAAELYASALRVSLGPEPRAQLNRWALTIDLGRTLARMGKFADAERHLRGAVEQLENAGGGRPPANLLRAARRGLAELYERWARAEPGGPYEALAAEWRQRARAAVRW